MSSKLPITLASVSLAMSSALVSMMLACPPCPNPEPTTPAPPMRPTTEP